METVCQPHAADFLSLHQLGVSFGSVFVLFESFPRIGLYDFAHRPGLFLPRHFSFFLLFLFFFSRLRPISAPHIVNS